MEKHITEKEKVKYFIILLTILFIYAVLPVYCHQNTLMQKKDGFNFTLNSHPVQNLVKLDLDFKPRFNPMPGKILNTIGIICFITSSPFTGLGINKLVEYFLPGNNGYQQSGALNGGLIFLSIGISIWAVGFTLVMIGFAVNSHMKKKILSYKIDKKYDKVRFYFMANFQTGMRSHF